MGRTILVAELASSHGGDVNLAGDMIRAAADAGADLVKLQSYCPEKIRPEDPQRDWLVQAHLDRAAHERLLTVAAEVGVELFSTPFCAESLQLLRDLGLTRFKVASSESGSDWWCRQPGEQWIASYPWGEAPLIVGSAHWLTRLTAIPLYPTPLEAVGRAPLLDGWSDHCDSLSACYRAIALGATMVEVHFCIPGKSRVKEFDKTAADVRKLRAFADDMATVESGVGQTFRERWRRA